MKWTLRKIRDHKEELLHFDVELDVAVKVQAMEPSILHLTPVQVTGYFVAHGQEIFLHCTASTVMTLPSTRSLEPVPVHLQVPIDERYVMPEYDANADEYEETTIVLEHDYIDLELAVIDALLLNLPMRVVGEEEETAALPSGKDWAVLTETDYLASLERQSSEAGDPRFANLRALLNEANADE